MSDHGTLFGRLQSVQREGLYLLQTDSDEVSGFRDLTEDDKYTIPPLRPHLSATGPATKLAAMFPDRNR